MRKGTTMSKVPCMTVGQMPGRYDHEQSASETYDRRPNARDSYDVRYDHEQSARETYDRRPNARDSYDVRYDHEQSARETYDRIGQMPGIRTTSGMAMSKVPGKRMIVGQMPGSCTIVGQVPEVCTTLTGMTLDQVPIPFNLDVGSSVVTSQRSKDKLADEIN